MTRLPYLEWQQAIAGILGRGYECPTVDLELMFEAEMSPVEAAAAIATGLFTEELNR